MSRKLAALAQKRLLTYDQLVLSPVINELRQLREEIENSAVILNPVPTNWEDFVQLCTIRSGGKMKRFEPYEYQKLLSRLMDEFNNIVIVKSRQLGTTQAIASKFLHRACLNPAYSSMAFMRNADDAGALSRRARQLLKGLQEYVKAANDNVGHLKLKGLGEIYFKNSSKEGSRSYDSVLDFLFDESAFVENIGDIYAASSPSGALAEGNITKMIVSTPSAKSGWYWGKLTENNGDKDIEELCQAVAAGEIYRDLPGVFWFVDEIGTVKLILHWKCHPVYSQREDYLDYRRQQDGTDEETVLREYDLRFVDSSVSVFITDIVRGGAIGVYEEERSPVCDYFIGIDTSTTGNDYCVAIVLKRSGDRLSVVALYRKRQQTSDYHLYQIGQLVEKYKPTALGIETTGGVGTLYLEQLAKTYPDLAIEGIRTGGDTKPVLISALQLKLEKGLIEYPENTPIVEELLNFRRQGKKLEASNGKHDDTVMGLAFAVCVADKYESGWKLDDIPRTDDEMIENVEMRQNMSEQERSLPTSNTQNTDDKRTTDVLIKCDNPAAFDRTVQSMGAALVQNSQDEYTVVDGCYVMRCFGYAEFVKFAIARQGYGEVVRDLENLI